MKRNQAQTNDLGTDIYPANVKSTHASVVLSQDVVV